MHYYEVSPLKIVHRDTGILTYTSNIDFAPGQIVLVPVGKASVAGVVIKKVKKPEFETKEILNVVVETPLPKPLLKLHDWMSSFYATHPVHVWQTILPSGITKKRRKSHNKPIPPQRNRTKFVLNTAQKNAFSQIVGRPAQTTLLHGITGSGKTAVYIELARESILKDRSVIILVPEIALTSQLVADFSHHFDNVIVTHSTMSEGTRHTAWTQVLNEKKPMIVIGPRSALFAPLKNIGLIVIDECHEPSYKQEKSPRYSALRAASVLATNHGARLVLGSATPAIQDFYVAQSQNAIVEMSKLARPGSILPTVQTVDMTKRTNFKRSVFLSEAFLTGLGAALLAGHQSLVFHNRRGSAPTTLCENCGWSAACPRCFVPMTLHADMHRMRCHLCNYDEHVPTSCPSCKRAGIIHKGIGTKRIVEELARLFPKAVIARFDGDTIASEALEESYQQIYDGEIDIIVGTQVVAKGLDLPKLRFVGIPQADTGLSLPDYQSTERVFQLLAQAAGRVGRNEHASHVVVQSYQPDHPSVRFGIARDYRGFYSEALAERKRAGFPPYSYLLKLTCLYKSESAAVRASRELATKLRREFPKLQILGPAPCFYERVRESYRWQLLLKSSSRSQLTEVLKYVPSTHWQFELEPASLL